MTKEDAKLLEGTCHEFVQGLVSHSKIISLDKQEKWLEQVAAVSSCMAHLVQIAKNVMVDPEIKT